MLDMSADERRALSENAIACAMDKFDYRRFSKELAEYLFS
jgi:hypothetical protein